MNANMLLFEATVSGTPLFKNQQDLVSELLTLPVYYVSTEDEEKYKKAYARLKTYISQLLSDNAIRTVTEDFKLALKLLLDKKVKDDILAAQTLKRIIEDLESRNSPHERVEHKHSSLIQEIANAKYVALILSNQLEEGFLKNIENNQSLSEIIFTDLLNFLSDKKQDQKYYRFNFPLEDYCQIFWMGFERLLKNEVSKRMSNQDLIRGWYEKFILKSQTYNEYELFNSCPPGDKQDFEKTKKELVKKFVENILEVLHRNKVVLTYYLPEPIYTVPTIALNPDNLSLAKLYTVIEDDSRKARYFKSTNENLYLWKIFVWGKIKTSKLSREIRYHEVS